MVLEKLNQAEIVSLLGGIYEHSPWVAEILFTQGITSQDNDLDFLADRMKKIVDASSEKMKLRLLQAHPELAGKLAISGNLTKDSTAEQASAGLDQCSKEEFAEFSKLNFEYTKKFGHPFIIAVKDLTRAGILTSFKERINNGNQTEFETAITEVHKIAFLRLKAL
jgi:2-oxo-4-hydroxy-4-carboxy-5-ureidoimidazoline decarboxylase